MQSFEQRLQSFESSLKKLDRNIDGLQALLESETKQRDRADIQFDLTLLMLSYFGESIYDSLLLAKIKSQFKSEFV